MGLFLASPGPMTLGDIYFEYGKGGKGGKGDPNYPYTNGYPGPYGFSVGLQP
jgi:hypothetical protein